MRLPKFSPLLLLIAIVYFLVTTLLHWRLKPDWFILMYALGAVIGLFLLDLFETFIFGNAAVSVPSPLRNIVIHVGIIILSFFMVTSTGSKLGSGVVLFLQLRLMNILMSDYRQHKHLNNWGVGSDGGYAKWYIGLIIVVFFIQTVLFLLS